MDFLKIIIVLLFYCDDKTNNNKTTRKTNHLRFVTKGIWPEFE